MSVAVVHILVFDFSRVSSFDLLLFHLLFLVELLFLVCSVVW